MRRVGLQDEWAVRSQSALALLLFLPSAILGPVTGQAMVLHEHGDIADLAHRVPLHGLGYWHAIHANQHTTSLPEQDKPATASLEAVIELTGTAPSGTLVLGDAAYALRRPSRLMATSVARLSVGNSMAYAYCSSNLPDLPLRPPELICHSPSGSAPSRVTAILRTNHTLLV